MTSPIVQIIIIEEHEPDAQEYPVIVVGAAWTDDEADAIEAERRQQYARDFPDRVLQVPADDDDTEDTPDVWWERHYTSLSPDVPAPLYEQLRSVTLT